MSSMLRTVAAVALGGLAMALVSGGAQASARPVAGLATGQQAEARPRAAHTSRNQAGLRRRGKSGQADRGRYRHAAAGLRPGA